MSTPRSLSLALIIVFSTTWAATLSISGLWLMIDGPQIISIPLSVRETAGLSAVTGGLFVFMFGVADRVFPSLGRRVSMWRVEMSTVLVFILSGAAAFLLVMFRGA